MIDFSNSDPSDIIMLQFLRDAISNRRVEQSEVNGQIRIFVDHIHEYLPYI